MAKKTRSIVIVVAFIILALIVGITTVYLTDTYVEIREHQEEQSTPNHNLPGINKLPLK